jgi:hypothetical protein
LSAAVILSQGRTLITHHSRLVIWWLASGVSRVAVWVIVAVVGAAAVIDPADGWRAAPVRAALRAVIRLSDAAAAATLWDAAWAAGLLTVASALCWVIAAFFDAGFYGYIARCVTPSGPQDAGRWSVLSHEAALRWVSFLGWTARRLATRGVITGCLAALLLLLLRGAEASADIASFWAVAAFSACALSTGLWWWRVRALRFMLLRGASVGRGLKSVAAEVSQGLGALVIGPGDVLLMWVAPGTLCFLLLGALIAQAQALSPALGVGLALALDFAFLLFLGFTDALISGALMSDLNATSSTDKPTPWVSPLPVSTPHIFRISDILPPQAPNAAAPNAAAPEAAPEADPEAAPAAEAATEADPTPAGERPQDHPPPDPVERATDG